VPMSEGDRAPRVHIGQAIWFETMMTRVASLSQNRAVVHAIRNVNDRTHYVRSIDLERSDVMVATRHSIERLWRSLQRADIAEAVAVLAHDRDGQIERLPTVIKEGLSRACTPTTLFAPVVPLSPPRIWTGATAASRPLACALMTARR